MIRNQMERSDDWKNWVTQNIDGLCRVNLVVCGV